MAPPRPAPSSVDQEPRSQLNRPGFSGGSGPAGLRRSRDPLLGIRACTAERSAVVARPAVALTPLPATRARKPQPGRPAEVRCCPCRAVPGTAESRLWLPQRPAWSSRRSTDRCRRVPFRAGPSTPADFLPSAVPARSLWRAALEEDRGKKAQVRQGGPPGDRTLNPRIKSQKRRRPAGADLCPYGRHLRVRRADRAGWSACHRMVAGRFLASCQRQHAAPVASPVLPEVLPEHAMRTHRHRPVRARRPRPTGPQPAAAAARHDPIERPTASRSSREAACSPPAAARARPAGRSARPHAGRRRPRPESPIGAASSRWSPTARRQPQRSPSPRRTSTGDPGPSAPPGP